MNKKFDKYDEYHRSRGPKVVHFDDDLESEIMSENIRKDIVSKEALKKGTPSDGVLKLETIQVINEKQKPFQLSTFDSKRNANQTIDETKVKHMSNEPISRSLVVNKFNVNNHNNNYSVFRDHTKTSTELMTRIPRLHQQRLQQQKYFKINAQKIVDFNPLVKYIKTLDSALRLEPIPLFSGNYSHKSFDAITRHQVPVAKSVPVVTTTKAPSVFYSYRYDTDPYRKVTTTPKPQLNVTQYLRAVSLSPTVTTVQRQTTVEKLTTNHRQSVDVSPLKALSTLTVPARPLSLFPTPDPFLSANKCAEKTCRLPDCFCGGTDTPGIN